MCGRSRHAARLGSSRHPRNRRGPCRRARRRWKPSITRTNTPSIARAGAWSQKAVEAFGRIDILMNNAGVNKQLNFFEVTERDWDWIHSINAKGLFFCNGQEQLWQDHQPRVDRRQRGSRHLERRVCGLQGTATKSLKRKLLLGSTCRFPWVARIPGTTSPTSRRFWPRKNHGISPANR